MTSVPFRRSAAVLVSAVLLASLAVVTTAAPASAKASCMGRRATIVGTSKGEVIRGTPKDDVIVARGGNDIVYGRGGDDIICGNRGNDRLVGGAGSDRLKGQHGRDTLIGGLGLDSLWGGPNADRLLGGKGHDELDGGSGRDVCRQGPASGPHVRCEDVPAVTPRNLAIAFSDLDGNDRYGPGDILISRLFDTNGDGIPSKGDIVYMGRYPTDFEMTAFADWGVATHTVEEGGASLRVRSLRVQTSDGYLGWGPHVAGVTGDAYTEGLSGGSAVITSISDAGPRGYPDVIQTQSGSPSQPSVPIHEVRGQRTGDQGFIDVVVYP